MINVAPPVPHTYTQAISYAPTAAPPVESAHIAPIQPRTIPATTVVSTQPSSGRGHRIDQAITLPTAGHPVSRADTAPIEPKTIPDTTSDTSVPTTSVLPACYFRNGPFQPGQVVPPKVLVCLPDDPAVEPQS